MKKIRKILALTLTLCMVMAMGVWNTDAHADWYTVQFTKVENKNFENVPTGISADKLVSTTTASTTQTSTGTTTGTKEDETKPGQIEYFYNPWAGTLVIRGKGAMVGFDEKHPAPWHTESKRALRIIIDEGITTISSEAFKDFLYVRSVVFPSTLKGIAENAFEKCEKLKRIEVVTEIEDAEKLVKASKSEELLKDDVKIVRVKKEDIRKEICWLTTYWVDRVEIYRDKAGRPIRIIEHKCDGSVIDTGIKYLNQATAVNEAKSPLAAERIYSVTTARSGAKSAKERELDEYGKTKVRGEYVLNSSGRQVSGTELYFDRQDTKRTLDTATYYSDGTGTKTWSSVGTYGGTTEIVEQVDKNDKILSVNSVTYDQNGIVSKKAETKNSYNSDGNKISTTITETDKAGNVTATKDTSYGYNGSKQLTEKTVTVKDQYGTSKTTSNYSYDSDGNLKTIKDNSDTGTSTVTEYKYTDKGKKTSKTITTTLPGGSVDTKEVKFDDYERASEEKIISKNSAGETVSTTVTEYSYNWEHRITQSISTSTDAQGNKYTSVTDYDSDGREIKVTWERVDSTGTSTGTWTQAYDANGNTTSSRQETKQADGTTTKSSSEATYDAKGRIVSEKKYDPVTKETENNSYTYDASGRIIKEVRNTTASDGTTTSTTTIYTYNADGSFEKKVVPLTTEEKTTVSTTEYNKEGTPGETKTEEVETAVVTEEIQAVKGVALMAMRSMPAITEISEDEDLDDNGENSDGTNNPENENDEKGEVDQKSEGNTEGGAEVKRLTGLRTLRTVKSVEEDAQEESKEEVKEETKEGVKEETKEGVKEEAKTEVKEEAKAEVKEEAKAEVKEEVKAEVKAEPNTEVKVEPQAAVQEQSQAAVQEQPKPQEQVKPQEQLQPQPEPQPQVQQDPPPHEHTFVKHVEVQPTCGKDGCRYDEYCCGIQKNNQPIPATGNHSWGEIYTKDDGVAYHACSVCGLEAAA